MKNTLKTGVFALTTLLAVTACSEEQAQASSMAPVSAEPAKPLAESLLDAPLNLTWLESLDSMIDRGVVGTYRDAFGEDFDWESEGLNPDDVACQYEQYCLISADPLSDTVKTLGGLFIQDGVLRKVEVRFHIDISDMDRAETIAHRSGLLQSLYTSLDDKFGEPRSSQNGREYRQAPLKVTVTDNGRQLSADNDELFVIIEYVFNESQYLELTHTELYDTLLSEVDL